MLRVVLYVCLFAAFFSRAAAETQWDVRLSEGLDALLFVGALTGDKLQFGEYQEEVEKYRTLLAEEELAALERLRAYYAEPGRGLAGPAFAFYFAAVPDQSYEGVGAALADPKVFLSSFDDHLSSFRDDEVAVLKRVADYHLAYSALDRIGFVDEWRRGVRPQIERKIGEFEAFLAPYDFIPVHEKYLGRDLEDKIEVILLHYNRPYGIRVAGQRFTTFHGWGEEITLHTAAHEIFHPPFDTENVALREAGQRLATSPLMKSIIAKSDPSRGYSSFRSIINEDSTQALDKLVAEHFNFGRDPGEYWRHQDGGMHLLAAAIYHAMKETGFAETGGVYEQWLIDALNSDVLSPDAVERRARMVVGDETVDKWID